MTKAQTTPSFLNADARLEFFSNSERKPEKIFLTLLKNGSLEEYTILKTLGSGGEATAYLAVTTNTKNEQIKRTIKIFNSGKTPRAQEHKINSYFSDAVRYAAFKNQKNQTQYLEVLPYKPGISLKAYLNTNEPDLERDSAIAVQFCQILNKIHHKSPTRDFVLTHCDLKQENLIVYDSASDRDSFDSSDTEPTEAIDQLERSQLSQITQLEATLTRQNSHLRLDLIDFGCAETLSDTEERIEMTKTKGTPYLMPPEQCAASNQNAESNTIGVKSDLYSATAILLRLLGVNNPTKSKECVANRCFILQGNKIDLAKHLSTLSNTPFDSSDLVKHPDPFCSQLQHVGIHFLHRLQHTDYEMRPDSHSLLFFFNSLHLLITRRTTKGFNDHLPYLKARIYLSVLDSANNALNFKDKKFNPYNEINTYCESDDIKKFCHDICEFMDRIINTENFTYYTQVAQILLKQSHELNIGEIKTALDSLLSCQIKPNDTICLSLSLMSRILSCHDNSNEQIRLFTEKSTEERKLILHFLDKEINSPLYLVNRENTKHLYEQLNKQEKIILANQKLGMIIALMHRPDEQVKLFRRFNQADRIMALASLKKMGELNNSTLHLYQTLVNAEIKHAFIIYYQLHCSWTSKHFGKTLYKKIQKKRFDNESISLEAIKAHIASKSTKRCQSRLFLQKTESDILSKICLEIDSMSQVRI